ncbi:MAG: isocitrate lyase/PEP mutase family protein [Chloroflexi bacterium]|nr:isocitrate lyase/PEP mutase family protein [Chloroflexota bacterium]
MNYKTTFRDLLRRPELLLIPGGFSPLLARMCELVGFETFFVAGSQTSAFLYGVPDTGIMGLRDMVDHVRHIAAVCSMPILVDADTGYGNAVNAHYAVKEYIRTGVAAVHIEDQEAPKKSGTVAGRRCISMEEAIGKFRAAAAARDELDADFTIVARCDLIGAEGGSFEEAVSRCTAYVEQGHADAIWLNTVETREQIAEACRRIPAPVIPVYGGPGPQPTLEEWRQMGAAGAIFPALTTSAALQATWDLLHDFKERGQQALLDSGQRSRASRWGAVDRYLLTGNARVKELEQQFIPADQQRDYDTTFGHRPN